MGGFECSSAPPSRWRLEYLVDWAVVISRSELTVIRFLSRCLWSAAGIAALGMVLPARASNPLVVKTDHGKVQGKMSADGQARDFLGIPYAAPPVGRLRWKPPQPGAKWDGVRQATSFGFRCMQQEP